MEIKHKSAIKKANMISQIVRLKRLVKRWKSNSRTPSGSVAVYVGPERRRFVIPTRFLNLPVFVALLDQAEEEFGFQPTGGLTLPCETGFFAFILRLLEQDEEKYRRTGLDGFLKMVLEPGFEPGLQMSCKEPLPSASAFYFFDNSNAAAQG